MMEQAEETRPASQEPEPRRYSWSTWKAQPCGSQAPAAVAVPTQQDVTTAGRKKAQETFYKKLRSMEALK